MELFHQHYGDEDKKSRYWNNFIAAELRLCQLSVLFAPLVVQGKRKVEIEDGNYLLSLSAMWDMPTKALYQRVLAGLPKDRFTVEIREDWSDYDALFYKLPRSRFNDFLKSVGKKGRGSFKLGKSGLSYNIQIKYKDGVTIINEFISPIDPVSRLAAAELISVFESAFSEVAPKHAPTGVERHLLAEVAYV